MTEIYHFKPHIYRSYGYTRVYHARGRSDAIDHAFRYCCCGPDSTPKEFAHMINMMVIAGSTKCTPTHTSGIIKDYHIFSANRMIKDGDEERNYQDGKLEDGELEDNSHFKTFKNEFDRLTWERVFDGHWPSQDGTFFTTWGYRRAHRAYRQAIRECRETKSLDEVQETKRYSDHTATSLAKELRRLDNEITVLHASLLEDPPMWNRKEGRTKLNSLIQERGRLLSAMVSVG